MSEPTKEVNPLLLLGVGLAVFVLFLLVYALPRYRANRQLADEINKLEKARSEIALLLPERNRLQRNLPEPTPDVRSWIAANALSGLEKNLVKNNSGGGGTGADVQLRKLAPQQVAQFFSQLTLVDLIFERLVMEDFDGDGRWDVEVFVKVPTR